jgi:hypothetical protein
MKILISHSIFIRNKNVFEILISIMKEIMKTCTFQVAGLYFTLDCLNALNLLEKRILKK